MKNISPFTEAKKDVREKNLKKSAAKGKPIRAVSNSDKDMLINSLANDDVFLATYYDKNNEVTKKNLRKNFLDSTKPMFREMGIDKNDLEKVNTLTIPKECTKAAAELIEYGIREYLHAGRKYKFPRIEENDSEMSVVEQKMPEIERENRFGNSSGKKVVTKERNIIKAKNVVPKHLKYTKD